ncbi:hypothetical protein [Actinorhabdospora filicis]|nr:hypothetical protein [Actinorhabdospora filicis]
MSNEPHPVIVGRLLSGTGSRADMTAADANFHAWIRDQWDGRDALALAYCVDALAGAYGPEWDALPERHAQAHVWLFSFLCPRREVMDREAVDYREVVARKGGALPFGDRILHLKGW